ncbi:MAG: septal ring lytic transglycosylase RlpA family protein [Proteobacteria bacterium]|nr:septal ring lytic transglycosylase RlpA family protein [Pseudomonadota bacterium]
MRQRYCHILVIISLCSLLAACSSGPEVPEFCTLGKTIAPKKATSRPYQIKGVWYYPQPHFEYDEVGMASYYGGGDVFHGRPTATGERFDKNGVSAAHKTLPLPCIAEVTNLENGRQIQLKVNDRGPFVEGRIIDVSRRTAQLLGFENKGTAKVRVRTIVPESLALHGIDPSTVMMAQNEPVPALTSASEILQASLPVVATASLLRLPDTLFEEQDDTIVDPEPHLISASEKLAKVPNSTGIFIDVGSYETQQQTQALEKTLHEFTKIPSQSVRNLGPKPYAVRIGPFSSMSVANQVLDQLLNAGHVMSRIVIHR